ncbi:hypothetical protein TrRE_jg11840 [Triparma retinervis]|uniref:Uncharacterized protein n=1 Tax=Triparma retinervis TaxID=2557542 RepID=A0A9W6ZIW4_9STRA|nr:hypothetical protein TrRE_jg11840 [Triparma retinervis]
MTCACRIASSSQSNSYREARPAPFIPNDAKVLNYILPCNSVPVDDNLVLEWDDDGTIQDNLWKLVQQERYYDEDTLKLGSDAVAKEMSWWAGSQQEDWLRRTENTMDL